jgi:hypothetical protein
MEGKGCGVMSRMATFVGQCEHDLEAQLTQQSGHTVRQVCEVQASFLIHTYKCARLLRRNTNERQSGLELTVMGLRLLVPCDKPRRFGIVQITWRTVSDVNEDGFSEPWQLCPRPNHLIIRVRNDDGCRWHRAWIINSGAQKFK